LKVKARRTFIIPSGAMFSDSRERKEEEEADHRKALWIYTFATGDGSGLWWDYDTRHCTRVIVTAILR